MVGQTESHFPCKAAYAVALMKEGSGGFYHDDILQFLRGSFGIVENGVPHLIIGPERFNLDTPRSHSNAVSSRYDIRDLFFVKNYYPQTREVRAEITKSPN